MVRKVWRGAVAAALLAGAGVAWSQSTPSSGSSEKTYVINENGTKYRCRLLQSWRLPDGTNAKLMQDVGSGEKITIVSQQPGTTGNRLFFWGRGGQASPSGAPLPPSAQIDSGVVIVKDTPQPALPPVQIVSGPTPIPNAPREIVKISEGGPVTIVNSAPTTSGSVAQKSSKTTLPTVSKIATEMPKIADLTPTKVELPKITATKVDLPLTSTKVELPPTTTKVELPKATRVELPRPTIVTATPAPRSAGLLSSSTPSIQQVTRTETPFPIREDSHDILTSPERISHSRKPVEPRRLDMTVERTTTKPTAPVTVSNVPSNGLNGIPVGVASVVAARNGAKDGVTFVPVPVANIPDITRPAIPPFMQMPEAPNPTAHLHNAFTSGEAMAQQPNYNAFGAPNPQAMAMGGMPMPFIPNPMMARGGIGTYNGPVPPNPFHQIPATVTPANYQQMQMAAYQAQQQAIAAHSQRSNHERVEQLVRVLKDAPLPSQREMAAQQLAQIDWRTHDGIAPALAEAARSDPAPQVRAGCVNCLAAMNVSTGPILQTLHALKTDSDERVRQEVQHAFTRLAPSQPTVIQNR